MSTFTFRQSDQFLARLAARLREAPQRVHAEMARRTAAAVEGLLDAQFRSGVDPYGRPWPPAKDRPAGPPMVRTGALRDGMAADATVDSGGVRLAVTASVPYAKYLQGGTRRMRARLIVPGSAVLARVWRDRLERVRDDVLREWLQGLAR